MSPTRVALYVLINSTVAALLIALPLSSRARFSRPVLLFFTFFAMDCFLTRLPRVGPFAALHWNWQGQLLSIVWVLTFGALRCGISLRACGITVRPRIGALPLSLAIATAAFLQVLSLVRGERMLASLETVLFQLTMPGIAEELVYRGVLLALLDRVLGRRWVILGARVGWGAVVVSVLFLSIHLVSVDANLQVHLVTDLEAWVGISTAAVVFAWLRERSGSVWPCVLAHNIVNGVVAVGSFVSG